jgi:glycosyltransferase involved in cell wall biosynthesis
MGLRIAVLSRNFASTGGGAERYSMAVVEQLASMGGVAHEVTHEVHVFAQTVAHELPGVIFHKVATPLGRPRWINQLYFAWATWRATRIGFDVVHSHENTWHGDVQTVHVLPIKYTLFEGRAGVTKALRWLKVLTSPRLLVYLWLEKSRYSAQSKRRVVVISNMLKSVMLKTYPHTQGMLEVIPPGVTHAPGRALPLDQQAARAALGLPLHVRCALFVGNDFRKKGLPTLLEALKSVPSDVVLAVVGASAQLADMQKIAFAQGVSHRVFFMGALQDITQAYRAADFLVHPSLEDTYAMVVLEAMAHGLPVVVSGPAYCGIAADLRHGVNALLLEDPKSTPELVGSMRQCVTDAVLMQSLSSHAQQFAKVHTWTQALQAYHALFVTMTKPALQRWLVLAHAFNMDGRAASQTITDKLPHLEKAGIELVILSGVSGHQDKRYTHYQLWPAGPAGIRFELRHVLRKRLGSSLLYRVLMVLVSLVLLPGMLIEKLLWPVESSWSWWLSAYYKGRWLARTQKFDLIYSTGGAFAAHIAAQHLKDALQVPWMAEVHDPLVAPGQALDASMTAQQRKQLEVEALICTNADLPIWFTEAALASAKRRHPQLADRGRMLLPGIDQPFEVLVPYEPGPKFVIGHFGSLSATRNLLPVLGAMEYMLDRHSKLRSVLELHVYGGPLDSVSALALEASTAGACVRHFGRIELDPVTGLTGREQILRRMRSADVLLLLHGEDSMCEEYIPSKMYEYLWMQRPVLAVVHRNTQMASLLTSLGHLVVSADHYSDSHQLAEGLIALYEGWETIGLQDNGQLSPYTTQIAVAQIVDWVNATLEVKVQVSTRVAIEVGSIDDSLRKT